MTKLKASKTARPFNPKRSGRMRWALQLKNGDTMDKYNDDGSKNVYCSVVGDKVKVHVPLTGVSSIGLTDSKGNVTSVMDVPDGAKVFQRRRVVKINKGNVFHDGVITVPAQYVGGRYYPEHKEQRRFPQIDYEQCWLIGWRTATELRYKCVYPDGTSDEYTQWNVKPWLKEPEWFEDELV